jgi:hypothetical protein
MTRHIRADTISFFFFYLFVYRGGVYDDLACDGPDVNHAVVLVGYGKLNGPSPSAVVANSARTNYAYNNHPPASESGNETYAISLF